jgi:hypothetical protein
MGVCENALAWRQYDLFLLDCLENSRNSLPTTRCSVPNRGSEFTEAQLRYGNHIFRSFYVWLPATAVACSANVKSAAHFNETESTTWATIFCFSTFRL